MQEMTEVVGTSLARLDVLEGQLTELRVSLHKVSEEVQRLRAENELLAAENGELKAEFEGFTSGRQMADKEAAEVSDAIDAGACSRVMLCNV